MYIEAEREEDGRWIAEVVDPPGALAYGATSGEAVARAMSLTAENTVRIGRQVSRREALRIAAQTLAQAECERLAFAEQEAVRD